MQQQPFELIKLRSANQSDLKSDAWAKCTQSYQLFYNEPSNKFILNQYKNIVVFNRTELMTFDIPIKKPIEILTYSEENKAIVYCTDRQKGIVYKSLLGQADIKYKDFKHIIHIEWLSDKCLADLIVVTQVNIVFMKLEDEKKGLKQMKIISSKINACWFEWRTETLVTCLYQDKGVLNVYHLKEKKNKNLYRSGGSIELKFKEDTNLNKFKVVSTPHHTPLFNKKFNDSIQIKLVNLYEKPILIVLNLGAGLLDFYQIQQNKTVKLPLAVNLPTDSPAIFTTYDNLILVHLKNDHFSFVYDIRRTGTQPVATPASIGPDQIYNGQILNRWVLTPQKQVYKWHIQPKAIFKYIKNQNELFYFLMRRRNSKMIVMQWIRQNMFDFKATVISTFFKQITAQHFGALKMQDNFVIQQTISPIDMYATVFFPLQVDPRKDRLIDLMLECLRQFVIYKIKTSLAFQQLVIQLLLQTKKQTILSQLVQSRLIQQSKQLANILYKNYKSKSGHQILRQVAIDIMYRQQAYSQLLKLFVEQGLIFQMIRIVRKYYEQIPLETLINIYKQSRFEFKDRLKLALIDLGRQLYPVTGQQILNSQLQKA